MPLVLVLGAGGPVGHAFHAGVLAAIRAVTGAHLGEAADLIIGTSAGAHAGALLRAGVAPEALLARRVVAPPEQPRRRLVPASPGYVARALRRPWRARPGRLIAALLPEGAHHAEAQGAQLTRLLDGERWPRRPLWIPAVCLDSGERVVFGRAGRGAPLVDLGTAVRCSSAVPAIRAPVRVGARRFVDGGIASATHADLAAEALETIEEVHGASRGPALVVVSSPLSRFPGMGRLVRRELRRLDPRRARALLLEPDAVVARAMGWNPMDARAAARVEDAAFEATQRRLAAAPTVRAALDGILPR